MACCGKARKLKKLQEERRRKLKMSLAPDPEWAKLRPTFNNQWKKKPKWCCGQIVKYLGPLSSAPKNKLAIVLTYLSGSGFSGGRVNVPCINKLFTTITIEFNKRKEK